MKFLVKAAAVAAALAASAGIAWALTDNNIPLQTTGGQFNPRTIDLGGTPDVQLYGMAPTDQAGNVLTTKSAYRFATGPVTTFATGPTDWFTITGSATKTVRVTNIVVCGTATAASTIDLVLTKHSTADTGGTTGTAPTAVPLDSNDAAVTAAAAIYTANPTVGTLVGTAIDTVKLNLGAAGAAGCVSLDYGVRNAQALVLRGVAQQVAVNLAGATMPAGISLDVRVELTEE